MAEEVTRGFLVPQRRFDTHQGNVKASDGAQSSMYTIYSSTVNTQLDLTGLHFKDRLNQHISLACSAAAWAHRPLHRV